MDVERNVIRKFLAGNVTSNKEKKEEYESIYLC